MKWHPDRNPGNEQEAAREFRKIRKAYDALLRTQRDEAHQADVPRKPAKRHTVRSRKPARTAVRPTNVPGADLRRSLYVPLEVALGGGEVVASFRVTEPCSACKGAGVAPGAERCDACADNAAQQDATSCSRCHDADAMKHRRDCEVCRGSGTKDYSRRVVVPVPPRAWDGQTLVVKDEGALGWSGGPRGDAVFTVSVVCPPDWIRIGSSLMGDLPVDFATAALGGNHEVEVLGQAMNVEIPPNCPPGKWLSLPDSGLGDPSGTGGCLHLRVVFSLPQYE